MKLFKKSEEMFFQKSLVLAIEVSVGTNLKIANLELPKPSEN